MDRIGMIPNRYKRRCQHDICEHMMLRKFYLFTFSSNIFEFARQCSDGSVTLRDSAFQFEHIESDSS